MARFITVHVRCDSGDCDTVGEEGDGTIVEKTLSIDGKQAKAFLLCKKHLEDFEAVVLPLMQAGIKVETTKRSRSAGSSGSSTGNGSGTSPEPGPGRNDVDKVDCQVDGCTRTGTHGLSNRTGMAQHVIRTHDYPSLAAYEAEFGTVD